MKKFIALFALLALVALPASALAAKAGDFELGGYIKLFASWDSTSTVNKNLSASNATGVAFLPNLESRTRFTAQDTRFNFKITGPDVFGAKTQGFIEIDFDGVQGQDPQTTVTSSWTPRLRHAFFRMDWPGGVQVLMGQYWGVFCNFWPDTIQSGPLFGHGMATQRLPQVRVTFKTGPWTFAGLMGAANDEVDNPVNPVLNVNGVPWLPGTGTFLGQRAVIPQFGGQIEFEPKEWYGKAAFFGKPRGFVANVSAGVQRSKYDPGFANFATFGFNNPGVVGVTADGATLTPWKVQASLFIPVLTTKTEDLRNTASIQLQFYVGQGLRAFGNEIPGSNTYFEFDAPVFGGGFANVLQYNRKLTKRYGGYAQAQYYFNNQWYVSYLFGFAKAYDVTQDTNPFLVTVLNPSGRVWAGSANFIRDIQEHDISLFYTPVKNFKFGLGYAYLKQTYSQITTFGSRESRDIHNHRVQFMGVFFF